MKVKIPMPRKIQTASVIINTVRNAFVLDFSALAIIDLPPLAAADAAKNTHSNREQHQGPDCIIGQCSYYPQPLQQDQHRR